jgi:hypothetical protein
VESTDRRYRDSSDLPDGLGTSWVDIDIALTLAESLLTQTDQSRRRTQEVMGLQAGVAIGAVTLSLVLPLANDANPVSAVSSAAIGLVAAILITAAGYILAIVPTRRRIRRDMRSMFEIVDPLREVATFVARKEQWSNTRQVVTRARLARFPIGSRSTS